MGSSFDALLRDATSAVARQWSHAPSALDDDAGATAALHTIGDAVRHALNGEAVPSLAPYPWTAEAPRVIALLRRELLARSTASAHAHAHALLHESASATIAARVLAAIAALEAMLVSLEEDCASQFVEHLVGPHALGLLVEVAHDIRSPLGSILFLVDRMRRGGTGPVTPMQERHLGLVHSAAFGLSALASDLMELAHGGARLFGPHPVAFSLAELLHHVRDVVQPIAEEKGLALRFSGPSEALRIGHPAAISRVLLNLVTNALKFTNNGSVTVSAETAGPGSVRFVVADTGRGMPAAVVARITQVFSHSATRDAYAFSSAGLGIAICRKLVDAMGGALSMSPGTPIGTRIEFTLALPVAPLRDSP